MSPQSPFGRAGQFVATPTDFPTDDSMSTHFGSRGFPLSRGLTTCAGMTGTAFRAWRRRSTAPPAQYMCWPPLIERVEPVMKPMSSSTRNSTPLAISLACPSRPTGMVAMIFSSTFSGTARTMSVSM